MSSETTTNTAASAADISGGESHDAANGGRMIGSASIAVGGSAAIINPMVSLVGFFLAMMGLTIAAPKNRIWSILGIVASLAGGAVGHFLHTTIF